MHISILVSLLQKIALKKLFILAFVLLPILCFAERNLCRKITKSYQREHGLKVITFKSPELPYLTAIKQCKTDTAFALLLHFYDSKEHFDAKGAAIEFSDGTILKNDDAKVLCQQERSEVVGSSAIASHSGQYLMQGFFVINKENIGAFTSKTIARIQLHNASQIIPLKDGINMCTYIKCLQERHP